MAKTFKFLGKTNWPTMVNTPYPPILVYKVRMKNGTTTDFSAANQTTGFAVNETISVPDDARALRCTRADPLWEEVI